MIIISTDSSELVNLAKLLFGLAAEPTPTLIQTMMQEVA